MRLASAVILLLAMFLVIAWWIDPLPKDAPASSWVPPLLVELMLMVLALWAIGPPR